MGGSYPNVPFLSSTAFPIQDVNRWIDTTHERVAHATTRAYTTRNVFGSGVRTLAVVRAVLTTIATLTTPLRHVILLGFVV